KSCERQRRQRRFVGGLEHHGAAGRKRRRDFSRDHRVREIPRRDRTADADRLLDRKQPRIGPLGRDGLAIDAAGFFGKELDIGAVNVAGLLEERGVLQPVAQGGGGLLSACGGSRGHGVTPSGDRIGPEYRDRRRAIHRPATRIWWELIWDPRACYFSPRGR